MMQILQCHATYLRIINWKESWEMTINPCTLPEGVLAADVPPGLLWHTRSSTD